MTHQVTPRMFSPSTLTTASVSRSAIWVFCSGVKTPSMSLTLMRGMSLPFRAGTARCLFGLVPPGSCARSGVSVSPVRLGVAPQGLRPPSRCGLGILDVQQMADAVDGELVDVGEGHAQDLGGLDPRGLGLGAQHRQDGTVDGGCLLRSELPLD